MNPIGKSVSWLRQVLFAHQYSPAAHGSRNRSSTAERQSEPGEVAWAEGMFFSSVPMERWNPDELIWRRGFRIYRKMLLDDQVRALISLKQAVIVSRKWRFDAESDLQRQAAAFFRFLLESNLQGSVSQMLREILTSQVTGFSLIEKIYESVQWQGHTYWGIRQ